MTSVFEGQIGVANDVFISHSSDDRPVAEATYSALAQHGLSCWMAPRDVPIGADWGESIVDAITVSRVMVLVLSSRSNDSPQVRREVQQAFEHGVPVIPMRIESVAPAKALAYYIGSLQWLDALEPPLEAHLDRLVRTIVGMLAVGREAAGAKGHVPRSASDSPPSGSRSHEELRLERRTPYERHDHRPSGPWATAGVPAPSTLRWRPERLSAVMLAALRVRGLRLGIIAGAILLALAIPAFILSQRPGEWPWPYRLLEDRPNLHVLATAFSPDGLLVAAGGYLSGDDAAKRNSIPYLKIWDVRGIGYGHRAMILSGMDDTVRAVAFSPEGTALVAGDERGVKIWEVGHSDNPLVAIDRRRMVTSLAFSSDGRTLGWVADGRVELLASLSSKDPRPLGSAGAYRMAFSKDGRLVAATYQDRAARLWDVGTGELRLTIRNVDSSHLAFSPDGALVLASAESKDALTFYDPTTGASKRTLQLDGEHFGSFGFSPDGRSLAAAVSGGLRLFDAQTGELRRMVRRAGACTDALTFSPTGPHVVSTGCTHGRGWLVLWEVK